MSAPLSRALAEPKVQPRPDEPRWFVAAPDGSHRKLAESELEFELRTGAVTGDTLIWRKGLAEWQPANAIERWQRIVTASGSAADAATIDDPALAAAAMAATAAPAVAPSQSVRPRRQTDLSFSASIQQVAPQRNNASPAARPQPDGETRLGVAAIRDGDEMARSENAAQSHGPSLATSSRATLDPSIASSQIAGLAGLDASQAAVSLPVVRAARLDAPDVQRDRDRLADRRMPSAAHRLPAHRDAAGRLHGAEPRGAGPSAAANKPGLHGHASVAGTSHRPSSQDAAESPRSGEASSDGTWAPATDTYVGPRDNFTRRLGGAHERDLLLAQVDRERNEQRDLRRWQVATLAASCVALIAIAIAGAAALHARRAQQALTTCHADTQGRKHAVSALGTAAEPATADRQ